MITIRKKQNFLYILYFTMLCNTMLCMEEREDGSRNPVPILSNVNQNDLLLHNTLEGKEIDASSFIERSTKISQQQNHVFVITQDGYTLAMPRKNIEKSAILNDFLSCADQML